MKYLKKKKNDPYVLKKSQRFRTNLQKQLGIIQTIGISNINLQP